MLLHSLQQLFNRRFGNHPIELGAVVVDGADVVDDHIVNLPLTVDGVEVIVDSQFVAVAHNLGFYLGIVAIDDFILELNPFVPDVRTVRP